jgi:cytochrome c
MANIVPENFVLSDQNIAEVQKRMPNRNGMTLNHGMWPDNTTMKTAGKPDTANKACMKDCVPEPKLASMLPDFARNAHGNLAEQVRMVGQARGADTTKPESKGAPAAVAPVAPKANDASGSKQAIALLNKYACTACHGIESKIVGPAYTDVAKKHAGNTDYLISKIKTGGVGVWGQIPMPPQSIPESDMKTIAQWIAQGAKK